ncbi:hypothetical protein GC173_15520 [bacterium]|nr:hypothetical protein [bacterium]
MTTVDRNVVVTLLILIELVAVAAALAPITPYDNLAVLIPLVLMIETVVYFIASMVANPRATIGMAFGTAVLFVIVRAVCGIVGGIIYGSSLAGESASTVQFAAWTNPVAVIVQVATLVLAGPYMLAVVFPDLLGRDAVERISGKAASPVGGTTLESNPAGGFIQAFSYEELGAFIRKSHGIEGFIIYSQEGLVVWHDLPLRIDIDRLTARVLSSSVQVGDIMQDNGLTKVRRVMVETREHFLFATTLNHNFGLILLFNSKVTPEEILSRIAVIAKSSREFLQWKYPALPLAAGMNKEKLSLEIA